jgi:hypothetical protein
MKAHKNNPGQTEANPVIFITCFAEKRYKYDKKSQNDTKKGGIYKKIVQKVLF